MDSLIARFPVLHDGDLCLCEEHGVAYQADMTMGRVAYGVDYLAKVDAYEGTEIAKAVNAGRCAMLARHLNTADRIIDWGAGSGAFVRAAIQAGFNAKGYDVIPGANERMKEQGIYDEEHCGYRALTAWDVLEHMEEPDMLLNGFDKGSFLFASVPLFKSLRDIRESKHYRPGEHLYYWTIRGFVQWLHMYGFRFLEFSEHEITAGRDSIGAFAFCKDVIVCECGGEVQLESFDPPRRSSNPEWIVRCRACGKMSRSGATEWEARALWEAAA